MIVSNLRDRSSASTTTSRTVLVDGSYSPADARDLVQAMLDAAVQFHKLRNLRSHVHAEAPDPGELHAIEDLKALRSQMTEAFRLANGDGTRLRLRSVLDLEIDEGPPSR